LSDIIKRFIQKKFLARDTAREQTVDNIEVIDRMIDENQTGMLDIAFLRRAAEQAQAAVEAGTNAVKITVLAPVGYFGLQEGLYAPDIDITLLGIGNHRYFLFHSAIGLVILRYFYRAWVNGNSSNILNRWGQKITGVALGAYALGVGIHLTLDVVQPKSVVFPFFGSLVDGTLVDDRIWLLGNSLWAFKISNDIFALCMASEMEAAKAWVKERFEGSDLGAVFSRDR